MSLVAPPIETPATSGAPSHEPKVPAAWDMVDEWGLQSFPASDPPSNW